MLRSSDSGTADSQAGASLRPSQDGAEWGPLLSGLGAPGGVRLRRIARSLCSSIGAIALTAVCSVVLLSAALSAGTHVFGYRTHIIIGPSMEPTIPLGSAITALPVDKEKVEVGDVIVFSRPDNGARVTHRVEHIESKDGKTLYTTKGDNNDVVDPWIVDYAEDHAWRVERHFPYLGTAMLHMQSRVGRIALVIVPTLLILVNILRWIWRDERGRAALGRVPGIPRVMLEKPAFTEEEIARAALGSEAAIWFEPARLPAAVSTPSRYDADFPVSEEDVRGRAA